MFLAKKHEETHSRGILGRSFVICGVPVVPDAFNAWVSSPAFAHGHRSEAEAAHGGAERPPVSVHSELWSYDIALVSAPGDA